MTPLLSPEAGREPVRGLQEPVPGLLHVPK